LAEDEVRAWAESTDGASLDDFAGLCAHLATLHPSRYGALVEGVTAVHLTGTHTVADQNTALRLVVLADRLYDRQVPLLVSGVGSNRLFSEEMLAGGYRKKYRRAISRLVALNRRGVGDG
jgi:cell division protein ZapE